MKRTIFFDIDGTLTGTITGNDFKQHPEDVTVLAGIEKAIAYYKAQTGNLLASATKVDAVQSTAKPESRLKALRTQSLKWNLP